MNRREFLKATLIVPVGVWGSSLVWAAVDDLDSFAYYQGLSPTEKRSPSRRDGTSSGMPKILRADIKAGIEKKYKFWHGHGGIQHMFTLTDAHFLELQKGKTIEPYTTVVDGHRHALRIIGT